MTIHGKQGTSPTAETTTILRTARAIIAIARDDLGRRAQVMTCLRAIRVDHAAGFERRYDVAVLRRYYDLLGARLRRQRPAYHRPARAFADRDLLAAADDLARRAAPRLVALGR